MSTTDTTTTETAATTEDALKAYQRKVREEALRVAKDQGWCDEGLNKTLRTLGLRENRDWSIPVSITTTSLVSIPVKEGETEEEARASLTDEKVREYYRLNVNSLTDVEEWHLFTHEEGEPYVVGEPDPTNFGIRERRNRCHASGPGPGYNCTLPAMHQGVKGTQHIAGNGTTISEVWDVTESQPPLFFGYTSQQAAEEYYGTMAWYIAA